MCPKIEHQIDLVPYIHLTSDTVYFRSTRREIILIDPSRYASPTFYFEAVLRSDVTGVKAYARMYNETDGAPVAGGEVWHDTPDDTRKRSGALTLPSTAKEYSWEMKVDAGTTGVYHAVRIIIVDTFTTLTTLEHQIELGDRISTSSDFFRYPSYPKKYLFEADKFDGALTVYFEATGYVAQKPMEAQLYNYTDGVEVSGSTVTISSLTPVRARSGTITLVDGKLYGIRYRSTTSGKQGYLNGAKIIIQQTSAEIEKTQLVKMISPDKSTISMTYIRVYCQIYLDKGNLPSGLTFYYEADLDSSIPITDLYNVTDGVSVEGSELQGAGRQRSGTLTLADLKEYDSRFRMTQEGIIKHLMKSWLIIDYVKVAVVVIEHFREEGLDFRETKFGATWAATERFQEEGADFAETKFGAKWG